MTSPFLNVQTFDGKVKGVCSPVKRTENEIKEATDWVFSQLQGASLACFQLIMSNQGNQDNANEINATDLLKETCYLILHHVEKTELLTVLKEQLSDCLLLGT